MRTKTVVIVQRQEESLDDFADWLRQAGYRVRCCGGPAGPDFGCWSYRFVDCPLWRQANLVLYDPWIATGPGQFGSGPLLEREHAQHPDTPILLWGSGGAIPIDVGQMLNRGEAEMLPTDLDAEHLVAAVDRLIGHPTPESAAV